ncbi:MAG TPA: site-specific DNA-methyltransferase [bacterium]|nr:site-specific DNA-methyltransferase [bacterium]
MNKLYFGDNLHILRDHIADESVDLIYLDPPFNSKANYNVLFKTPAGHESTAQIQAFEDTWHWNEQAESEFREISHQSNTDVAALMQSLRQFLGENDMMAYLTMMANRLLELHRVLKPTGSIYLHCDPTASHYLKILMDAVFEGKNFRNEIIWSYKRYTAQSNRFQRLHDVILFYGRSEKGVFNEPRDEYGPNSGKADSHYKQDEDGRWFRWQKRKGQEPYKIFLSEGKRLGDVWEISHINASAKERMGYDTQKPQLLLERIVEASSNEGDVVLDPFCGCGTAIHAAQKHNRQWIGIDITHLAITLIEKRIKDAFPGIVYEVEGTPKDFEGARNLALRDKYQFQWWACSLVNAQPYKGKKKGADGGIDGLIYFEDDKTGIAKKIIVSVKGGDNIGRTMIADLKNSVDREKAQIGIFITLVAPTRPMEQEAASAGYYESPIGKTYPKIQILTIEELLAGAKRPEYFDLTAGGLNFKKTKKESSQAKQESLF